jgi:hypothetical protein
MTIHKVLIDSRKVSPERILEIAKFLKQEAEEKMASSQKLERIRSDSNQPLSPQILSGTPDGFKLMK